MTVVCDRDGADLDRTRRLGSARFEHAVRQEITRRGGQKPSLRILRKLFVALTDRTGVTAYRRGALERVQFLLADWAHAQSRLADTEARMIAVLDELELTGLATSITGLSPVGAAAILAETGDPRRFATARALVKHAGLAPREKLSGTFTGRTKLTGQGRPGLRLAAWRAVWGALRANPVYGARYRHLTGREDNKFTPTRPRQRSLPRSCGTCTPSSPPVKPGTRPSPPTAAEGARRCLSPPESAGPPSRVGASPTRH